MNNPKGKWYKVDQSNMEVKLGVDLIYYGEAGCIQMYDETALRKNLLKFLSNESFDRYGGDNFCDLKDYYKGIEWHLEGLKLFYCKD